MHKIALEPKEFYKLWVDTNSAGVEEVDLERSDHTAALRNILFSYGAIHQLAGGL